MDQQAAGQHPERRLSDAEAEKAAGANTLATSVLQNSNDLVAAVDSELRFVALNAPFRREFELIFGIPVQSGQRLGDILAHLTNDREKAAALCRRALAGESFRVVEDFGDDKLLRKSYELAFTPIFDTYHQP
ncbi:MAG: PAS domain-containing protein, partial [Bacillota bacterium]